MTQIDILLSDVSATGKAMEKAKEDLAKVRQHKAVLEMQLVSQIYSQISEKAAGGRKEGPKLLLFDLLHAIEEENLEDVMAVVKEMMRIATKGDEAREEEAYSKLRSMLVQLDGRSDEDE